MEILYKNRDAIIVYKPPMMPSQPDPTSDPDAMTLTSKDLKESGEPDALWLVHRLDRVVGGLMVFARNKKSAAALSELVSGDGIGKEYIAVCDGNSPEGELVDLLLKDSAKGKSFVVDRVRGGVKEARSFVTPISSILRDEKPKSLVKVKLVTGRFHQIRAQLSSRKAPITGDGKYGSHDNKARVPALFAYRLSFTLFGKRIEAKKLPDFTEYPWSLFDTDHLNAVL